MLMVLNLGHGDFVAISFTQVSLDIHLKQAEIIGRAYSHERKTCCKEGAMRNLKKTALEHG
jgi:hypothetical protein